MRQDSPSDWLFSRLALDVVTGRVYWRNPSKYHAEKLGIEAGTVWAGTRSTPYWVVRLDGKAYKRSRIVFCMMHGRWPEPCVDHINGDSLDDRPANLREATLTENAWNHKRRAKRSLLPMGVRALGSRYQARIACNKMMHCLGVFDTPEAAADAYQRARKEYFREFA